MWQSGDTRGTAASEVHSKPRVCEAKFQLFKASLA